MEYQKACSYCRKIFTTSDKRQKCCSRGCGGKLYSKTMKAKKIGWKDCEYCGKPFHPSHQCRDIRCCSPECSTNLRFGSLEERLAKLEAKKATPIVKQCKRCGVEFETFHPNHKFCSHKCTYESNLADKRNEYKENYESKKFHCEQCGKKVTTQIGYTPARFCSSECSQKYFKRSYKKQRKEQMREAYVAPVSYKKIYRRDKGICGICGWQVADNKEPTAIWGATIDHCIPLSRGGTHEPNNCQLAHRICNSLKLDDDKDFKIDWNDLAKRDGNKWNKYVDEYKSTHPHARG
jgi:hypothetical protein